MSPENKAWIRAAWNHWRAQRHNDQLMPTYVWDCVKVTIALLLNRERPELLDDCPDGIAWRNFGTYWTDYGTGKSWDYLVVGPRFTYAIGSDGSL